MTRTICEGLQVIEMGAGSIGASLAGMLLADNGARVLKVEPPEGDRLRSQHPAGFLVWNRGKESLVADLRTDEGRTRVRDLASRADVVIEGFGAGVADGWGLGAASVRGSNPGPRLLLGERVRLERCLRQDPCIRGHRRGQGRRLQPRAVRLPLRPDFRQRTVGQRRHRAHGVQRRARGADRARDDRARAASSTRPCCRASIRSTTSAR